MLIPKSYGIVLNQPEKNLHIRIHHLEVVGDHFVRSPGLLLPLTVLWAHLQPVSFLAFHMIISPITPAIAHSRMTLKAHQDTIELYLLLQSHRLPRYVLIHQLQCICKSQCLPNIHRLILCQKISQTCGQWIHKIYRSIRQCGSHYHKYHESGWLH